MADGFVQSLNYSDAPWQRLYFFPEPQGQGEFLETPDAEEVAVPSSDGDE